MTVKLLLAIAMFASVVGCGKKEVTTDKIRSTRIVASSQRESFASAFSVLPTTENATRVLNFDSFRDCEFLPAGFLPLNRGNTFLETHYLDLMDSGYRKSQMRVLFFAATNQLLARMRSIDRNGTSLYLPQYRSRFENYCLDKLSEGTLLPYAIATVTSGQRRVTSQEFELLQREFAENLGVYWISAVDSGAAKMSQTMSDWLGKQTHIYATASSPQVISSGDNHVAFYVPSMTASSDGGRVRVTMQATMTLLNIKGTLVTIYTYSKPSDSGGLQKFAGWIDDLVERLG